MAVNMNFMAGIKALIHLYRDKRRERMYPGLQQIKPEPMHFFSDAKWWSVGSDGRLYRSMYSAIKNWLMGPEDGESGKKSSLITVCGYKRISQKPWNEKCCTCIVNIVTWADAYNLSEFLPESKKTSGDVKNAESFI